MKQTGSILALAGLVSMVNGHGFVTSPQPRMPGSAMEKACGQQVYNNQKADNYGNIQGELQITNGQNDYDAEACDIWLCKGYKYADNTANVQSYKPGETVDFKVDIRAPHTGTANVSVVDTATNTLLSQPLVYWSVYASTATGVTANETSFSITMPEDLGDKCNEAGACVLQWWWDARSIDQTYESCVDFTMSGSSSSDSSSSSPSSAAAAVSTSAAETTTAASVAVTSPAAANNIASSGPTTLATSVKQTATAAADSSSSATSVSFPTDGTAEEQLTFIASVFKALLNYAN
ncbi:lytic polysaccharide monooxygenase [Aspergillus homomorphus CBS 101889]|uniref:Chitin binding protein n=1 Tax=Aspergillus homomorphus (strain CBS 101889) TaxID=1450537 RepID=A0A395I6N2_ASPHC|nr:chitin binding protein [Aspergillus homomorphus CBS 101889]RAL15707.1 chitin binding protein [Aspergillus homomorphus CBS 101889]